MDESAGRKRRDHTPHLAFALAEGKHRDARLLRVRVAGGLPSKTRAGATDVPRLGANLRALHVGSTESTGGDSGEERAGGALGGVEQPDRRQRRTKTDAFCKEGANEI